MYAIYKYSLEIKDEFKLSMPEKAKILSVQIQDGKPVMWAVVRTNRPLEERHFKIFGTGHEHTFIDCYRYISTFQLNGYVWHLFSDD